MKLTDANTRLIVDTYKRKRNGLLLTHALLGHEMVKDMCYIILLLLLIYGLLLSHALLDRELVKDNDYYVFIGYGSGEPH